MKTNFSNFRLSGKICEFQVRLIGKILMPSLLPNACLQGISNQTEMTILIRKSFELHVIKPGDP